MSKSCQWGHGTNTCQITGSTDGGIVIFGSPGSTISRISIISSDQNLGFGAINMVDGEQLHC